MQGWELVEKLSRESISTPIVVASGEEDLEEIPKDKSEFSGFISRPFNVKEIQELLNRF